MSSSSNLFLNLKHLQSIGHTDLNADDSVQKYTPGALSIMHDRFGTRIFQYVKNVNGSAIAKAELMAYASDGANVKTTTITNISAGSTTSATTSGLTANRHDGMIAFVLDDAGGAGAAPEGEMSIVASNTATVITMEADYPYSAALAANDDLELIATYQVEDAADGDEAWTVAGIVSGADGITHGQYGWVQCYGVTPALMTTNAISEGDPVVAGAAVVDAFGTDGQELWVGIALASGSTDEVLKHIPVDIRVWASAGPGGSP